MSDQHDGTPPPADRDTPTPQPPETSDSYESHDALSGPTSSTDPLSSGSYDSGTPDAASSSSSPPAPGQMSPSVEQNAPADQPGPPDHAGQQASPAPAVPPMPDGPRDENSYTALSEPSGEPVSGSSPATKSKIPPLAKRIGSVVLILIIGFVVKSAFNRSSADVLEVGQCVSRDGNDISQVDCGDAQARYKVLVISKDTTEASIEQICTKAPGAIASYFESKEGAKTGDVICLGTAK